MVLFNYSTRELTAKIVYYGPGICGKTTNLQFIHENLPGAVRGKMLSLATKTDRTLFFDFLPIDLGEIRGMKTRVQLYTVPGQVFYNETRKLVLKGVDGIVFVADSQETMAGANVESFRNLEENLKGHGIKLAETPHVIQFNKRDLPKLSSIEDLNSSLNKYNAPFYESVATTGIGVQDTLKAIVKLVLLNLTKKYESKSVAEAAVAAAAAPQPARAVAVAAAPVPAPAPAPARVAAPVAEAPVAARATAEAERAPVPVSANKPAAGKRRASPPPTPPAPPPKQRKPSTPPPAEVMSPFAESEIDNLVGEVGDVQEIPVPVAAAPVEEGAWIGQKDDQDPGGFGDDSSTYGSSVPLEDLLEASESKTDEPERMPAPAAKVAEPAWRPEAHRSGEFEVDRGFDPEWMHPAPAAPPAKSAMPPAPPVEDVPAPVPFPMAAAHQPPHQAVQQVPQPTAHQVEDAPVDTDVRLTELASNEDLFTDPSLEIAHLVVGDTREIMVPVMLGEGATAGRFKLAIRLRLEPVE